MIAKKYQNLKPSQKTPWTAIPLTKGALTLVDNDDLPRVLAHSWCLDSHSKTPGYYRAFANIKGKMVKLHRFILHLNNPDQNVDHINGNPLDNRKSNLRLCTRSENQCNRPKMGISFDKKRGCWISYINKNGKRTHLGRFDSREEAEKPYKKAAAEIHGEFARFK